MPVGAPIRGLSQIISPNVLQNGQQVLDLAKCDNSTRWAKFQSRDSDGGATAARLPPSKTHSTQVHPEVEFAQGAISTLSAAFLQCWMLGADTERMG